MKLLKVAPLLAFAFIACTACSSDEGEKPATAKPPAKAVKASPAQNAQAWSQVWNPKSAGSRPQAWMQIWSFSSANQASVPKLNSAANSPKASTKQLSTAQKPQLQISKPATSAAQSKLPQPAGQSNQSSIVIRPSDPNAPRKTHVWQAAQLPSQATGLEQTSTAKEARTAAPAVQSQTSTVGQKAASAGQKSGESIGKKLGSRRRLGASPKRETNPPKRNAKAEKKPAPSKKKRASVTPSTEF